MAINLSRIGNKKHRIEARTITAKSFNFVALWMNTSDLGYVTGFEGQDGAMQTCTHCLKMNFMVLPYFFSLFFFDRKTSKTEILKKVRN